MYKVQTRMLDYSNTECWQQVQVPVLYHLPNVPNRMLAVAHLGSHWLALPPALLTLFPR